MKNSQPLCTLIRRASPTGWLEIIPSGNPACEYLSANANFESVSRKAVTTCAGLRKPLGCLSFPPMRHRGCPRIFGTLGVKFGQGEFALEQSSLQFRDLPPRTLEPDSKHVYITYICVYFSTYPAAPLRLESPGVAGAWVGRYMGGRAHHTAQHDTNSQLSTHNMTPIHN
ncbi:hypothetical protein K474DRAFT_1699098 [Panus rudis PR-1116 ss-1]|nr:hypothetical protein K474DRAFT_1699098 [Panus rudis PR-1116 ss-1]